MFHILVVEDDAKLRSLFCTVLTNNGYLALPAESGEKALSLLDSEYVDLIISDIMMSGMDGYELFYPQLGVKLCSMAGGGVQKIYMVFLREPSRRDRSGSDLFHLRDGFEIKMNFDRNVSCFIFVYALMHDDFFD